MGCYRPNCFPPLKVFKHGRWQLDWDGRQGTYVLTSGLSLLSFLLLSMPDSEICQI